jgi:enoyl-CoA hydratase/carnithine racemase
MSDGASIDEHDAILTIRFERPEKRNAINSTMTRMLWDATTALADRDDLRCMVITGVGSYFTAGMDITEPVGNRPGNPSTEAQHPGWNFRRNYRSHHLLYDEWEAIEKPIIVAAQGHCLGAGLELAASCDFRFCSPDVRFSLPELRLGFVAGSGGTSRLTRLVGPSWGKWLAMAGREVDAEAALRMGLVQEVFPAEGFMDHVYQFCRELNQLQPEVVGMAKVTVDLAADVVDRTSQRNIDRIVVTSLMHNPAVRHGLAFRPSGAQEPKSSDR